MTLEYIHNLYAYNRWANQRVLDSLDGIAAEKLAQDMGNSFPSIRDTLVHILAAERLWLTRWQGESPPGLPAYAGLSDMVDIRAEWSKVEQDQSAFLEKLTPEELASPLSYKNTSGMAFTQPLWEQMCHLVNHSTYHRGQVTTMLRQMGEKPVSTDLILYLRA